MPVLILAIAIATGALFWFLGVPWLRSRRRLALSRQPILPQWREWLSVGVPAYDRLPADMRKRLDGLVQVFVREKSFVGCNGLEVTDRMRVIIAGNACLLLVNRSDVPRRHLYDDLFSILIYPTPFIVPETFRDPAGLVSEGRRVLSGQAWDSRRIILSWEDVEDGPAAGHNVVLHEFAHYLDMEDETMDGAPGLASAAAFKEWSEVFWSEYNSLRISLGAGEATLLDPYAATAPAEFFAVATEAFFGQSLALQTQHPRLYQQLSKYYRLDPARWQPAQ